jgi:hypothetical protein
MDDVCLNANRDRRLEDSESDESEDDEECAVLRSLNFLEPKRPLVNAASNGRDAETHRKANRLDAIVQQALARAKNSAPGENAIPGGVLALWRSMIVTPQ